MQTCSDNLDTYLRDDTNKISQPCYLKRLHRILLTYRTGWDQTRLRLAAESDGTLSLRCGGSVTTHHSWDHLSLSKMINAWKIWKLILLFYKKWKYCGMVDVKSFITEWDINKWKQNNHEHNRLLFKHDELKLVRLHLHIYICFKETLLCRHTISSSAILGSDW